MWSTWFLVAVALLLAVGAWLILVWAIRSGQYDNVEDIKYRILEDDDEDKPSPPAPTREA